MAFHGNPRILVIDDDPDMASVLKRALTSRLSALVTTAGDCASARQALADSTFDVITMDYELPDGNGIDLMEEILSAEVHPPVVMVTGKGDEKTAARACRVGALGYVVKDQKLNTMLVSVVQNALERAHATKLQSNSETRYRRLFESARDGILILDADTGEIEDANPFLVEILGYSLEEFIGRQLWEIGPFKDAGLSAAAFDELKENRYIRYENLPLETKDGRGVDVEFVSNIYMCDHREVIQCNIRDITVRKRKEMAVEESEAWYRALYESSKDGIVVVGLEGRIIEANPAYLDMLGYTIDEIRKLTYEQLTPKKWHKVELGILRDQVMDRGYSDDYEKEDMRKDGSLIPVTVRRWLIQDEQGNPSGMWAIVRDITRQKEAEEALRESGEMYRTLVETSPDAIVVSDNEGTIKTISSRTMELFGYESADELVGRDVFEIFAPEERQRAAEYRRMRYEGKAPRTIEYVMLKKDGTRFDVELSASAFHDPAGNASGIIGIARDITERKSAAMELQRVNTELEGFAHTVSHDLRSPLSAIGVASETLKILVNSQQSDETRADTQEVLEVLCGNVEKSSNLIESMLALAEAGQVPQCVSAVDIGNVVEIVIEERAIQIKEERISVDIVGELGHISANPTQMYQLFANIIGNAIVYNDSRSPRITIARLEDDERGGHRFLVRDNGSGIPPDDLDKVFIPFFKGETGETGIGLSTVQKIVKIYGGGIKAYNDNGACFEFTLVGREPEETA